MPTHIMLIMNPFTDMRITPFENNPIHIFLEPIGVTIFIAGLLVN